MNNLFSKLMRVCFTAIMRFLLALAVVLRVSVAYASGACWPVFFEAAGGPGKAFDSNCSMTGTLGGSTLPACTDASDGGFYTYTWVSPLCSSAATYTVTPRFVNQDGTAATGSVCTGAALSVLTADADSDTAAWTWYSPEISSTDLTSCDGNNPAMCDGTVTPSITAKDLSTGTGCASTTCNSHRAVLYLYRDTGASCTGDSTTTVTYTDAKVCCN